MINVKPSNCTREIGKPSDWDERLDGPCISLPVRDEVEVISGVNFMLSLWRPTAEDLAVLNCGGMVALRIAGYVHPVISLEVTP